MEGILDSDSGEDEDVSLIPFSTDSVTSRTCCPCDGCRFCPTETATVGVQVMVFPDPRFGVSPMTQSTAEEEDDPFAGGTDPEDETLE